MANTATTNTRNLIGERGSKVTVGPGGSATPGTRDVSGAFGGTVRVVVTSGASFSAAADVRVYTGDGTNWERLIALQTETDASTDYPFHVAIEPGAQNIKVEIDNNDGSNSITAYAVFDEFTSIATD